MARAKTTTKAPKPRREDFPGLSAFKPAHQRYVLEKTRERIEARRLIDASYAELADRPVCPGCGRRFRPKFETQTTCGGACAVKLMRLGRETAS